MEKRKERKMKTKSNMIVKYTHLCVYLDQSTTIRLATKV